MIEPSGAEILFDRLPDEVTRRLTVDRCGAGGCRHGFCLVYLAHSTLPEALPRARYTVEIDDRLGSDVKADRRGARGLSGSVIEVKVGTASPRAPGAGALRSASTEGDWTDMGE